MEKYEALARELFASLNQHKKGPPLGEVNAAVRGEMAVMRLLALDSGAVSAGEISRRLGMTTSRIAAVLGALEKKGLIIRASDEDDHRRVLVKLTEAGMAASRQRQQQAVCDMAALLAHLGEEDAEHFVRIMKRIHAWEKPPYSAGAENREGMD